MKTMTRIMSAVALAVMLPATSPAGVWDDCVLWYNGGAVDANGDGKFSNGEMLDIRRSTVECPVPLTDTEWHTYSIELDESNLVRGADNVLTWENSESTFYVFDYHELAVRKPRSCFVLIFR